MDFIPARAMHYWCVRAATTTNQGEAMEYLATVTPVLKDRMEALEREEHVTVYADSKLEAENKANTYAQTILKWPRFEVRIWESYLDV
jgi:hypothetical protein